MNKLDSLKSKLELLDEDAEQPNNWSVLHRLENGTTDIYCIDRNGEIAKRNVDWRSIFCTEYFIIGHEYRVDKTETRLDYTVDRIITSGTYGEQVLKEIDTLKMVKDLNNLGLKTKCIMVYDIKSPLDCWIINKDGKVLKLTTEQSMGTNLDRLMPVPLELDQSKEYYNIYKREKITLDGHTGSRCRTLLIIDEDLNIIEDLTTEGYKFIERYGCQVIKE